MIHSPLFHDTSDRTVRAALIGAGTFGTSLLSQACRTPRLELRVLCDRDEATIRQACRDAEVNEADCDLCSSAADAASTLSTGRYALLQDSSFVHELPVDVVIECTGDAEAGARHCDAAIRAGKHVAVVTKETDAVIGPLLHARAAEYGVVYTPVDGDQHGLLIGLLLWARSVGFRVIAAGKARDADLVFDESEGRVSGRQTSVVLRRRDRDLLKPAPPGEIREWVARRRQAFGSLAAPTPADLCEMVIVADHTGLQPDTPELHAPALRLPEVPEAFCSASEGGLLGRPGAVDVFACLRRRDEPGMMGGEFLVVECSNAFCREFLRDKGMLMNARGTAGLVYRPLHLLGAEAPLSVLSAGLASLSTGAPDVKPRADLCGRARLDIPAGTLFNMKSLDKGDLFEPLMLPATPVGGSSPLPLFMAAGCRLACAVAAGRILGASDIEPPRQSCLWSLRQEQDRRFFGAR